MKPFSFEVSAHTGRPYKQLEAHLGLVFRFFVGDSSLGSYPNDR